MSQDALKSEDEFGDLDKGLVNEMDEKDFKSEQRKKEIEDKEKDKLQSAAAMRRTIYILMCLLTFILLIHILGFLYLFTTHDGYEHPYACLTPNCQSMSKYILEGIEPSYDPCDDFHAYACEKYVHSHPVKSKNHTFKDGLPFTYDGNQVLGRILKRVPDFPTNQFLLYYQGCMHKSIRNNQGFKPFASLLTQLGLLYLPQMGSIEYNIASLIIRIFHMTNKLFFFDLINIQDNMIVMSVIPTEPELLIVNASGYYEIIKRSFRMMKGALLIEDEEEIDTIAYLVMRFEAELSHIQSKGAKMKSLFGFPHQMNQQIPVPKKLHKNFITVKGTFEWEYYVMELMDISEPENSTFFFNYHNSFLNREDRYYSLFMEYFLKETPFYIIFRYLQWSLVKLFAFDLTDELSELMSFYYRGVGEGNTEKCFRSVFNDLHVLAAGRYAQEIKDVDHLQANMVKILDKITGTLIDLSTNVPVGLMESIRDTLTTLKITQSYDKEIVSYMSIYYDGLVLNNEYHFYNVIKARSIKTRNALRKLIKIHPYQFWPRGTYSIHIITYGSIADQEKNIRLLNIPFGAMQEPYMGNDLPILNYAGFGFYVVAYHLMFHMHQDLMIRNGKDRLREEPCQFVQNQKMLEVELLPRWECLFETMSLLRTKDLPDLALNPYAPKSRLMALAYPTALDLMAEVLRRVKEESEKNPENPEFPKYQILPKLEHMEPDQLFFLAIARQLCRVTHKSKRKGLILNGPIPFEIKIKTFRFSEAFTKAFKCKPHTYMNPQRRCKFFERKNPLYEDPKYHTCKLERLQEKIVPNR